MSITSQVSINTIFGGDVINSLLNATTLNPTSPSEQLVQTLAIGDNTILPPSVAPTGLLIVPPSGNTVLILLKQTALDVGIPLHKTNPTFISLDSTFVSLVLNAALQITGVRLIWS